MTGTATAQTSFVPTWSSYVGGDWSSDNVSALATDSATNTYFGGALGQGLIQSLSEIGVNGTYMGAQDAFVAKVSPDGSLLWYSCLGAEDDDRVAALALGTNGTLFAAGSSGRYDAYDEDAGTNACLWALDRVTGATITLLYATGSVNRISAFTGLAVDTNGYLYVAGYTSQTGLSRNVSGYSANGTLYGQQLQGGFDACVLKVSPSGNVVWFHYLGGTNDDAATSCAVAPDGTVYVAGETRSPGWASTSSGTPGLANKDGFLVKLSASGAHVWSTFLGGSGADAASAVSVAASGGALLVGGATASSDFLSAFTRLNAYAGGTDGFVARLTDTGSTFSRQWCRFLGTNAADRVSALSLLPSGLAVVGGATGAGGWLTLTGGSSFQGAQDGFVCGLDAAGSVTASAYVGGSESDEVRALAPLSNALMAAGVSHSSSWVNGGFWTEWNKFDDPFVGMGDFGFVGKWLSEPGVPASVTSQPSDLTVHEGQPASFAITAQGTAPLGYRWYRNGAALGAPSSNLYLLASAAVANNSDTYFCQVSNAFGVATSQIARLTVIARGTLSVTLAPAQAAAQGARWRLSAGGAWFASGGSTNLPPGAYGVTFTNLAGWSAPAPLAAVQVLSGVTTATSGLYVAILPSASRVVTGTNVAVTVRAPAGLSTWTFVETLQAGLTPTSYSSGGVWNSGARTLTFTGSEAATNTLTYTVSCTTSGVYSVSGTVTPQPSGIAVAVTGTDRITKANFVRTISGTRVSITVTQPSASVRWHVYEYPPEALSFTITGGEALVFESFAGYIDWTKRGVGETVSYEVLGPPGTYTLDGIGEIGSVREPIFGDTVLVIPSTDVPPPDIMGFMPVAGGNLCALSFTSVVGQAYMIVTNATLRATNGWAACLSVTGESGVTVREVPRAGAALFYRVRVVQ